MEKIPPEAEKGDGRMRYGAVEYVGKPVSRVVFGTATPVMFQAFRSVYGEAPDFSERLQRAFAVLDGMHAQGINCFDCANQYGEEPLGEWMEARGLRDEVVVLTKGAHHNAWRKRVTDYDILSDVHDSLAKLRTDHIDIYLLHRDDPDVAVGPILEVLNKLADQGKIRAFGVSNWSLERFEEAAGYASARGLRGFGAVSPNYGLAEQVADPWGGGCVSISGKEGKAARDHYAGNGIAVFAYSPLARGLFSGRFRSGEPERARAVMDEPGVKGYLSRDNLERLRRCENLAEEKGVTVPEIAMAWLYNQPDLSVFAVSGSSSPDRMRTNIAAAEIVLSAEERAWLNLEA